jgi:predicted nucleic-acid-binding Zn-ribbon protein
MNCSKCGGKVYLDKMFSENSKLELCCVKCGRRVFVEKSSELGKWLLERDV